MKAVIAALAANLGIAIAKFAAFFLTGSLPFFPPQAIHIVVVDPGVGTNRALLLVEIGDMGDMKLLVPDNGCWTLLERKMPTAPTVRRLEDQRVKSEIGRIESPAEPDDKEHQPLIAADRPQPAERAVRERDVAAVLALFDLSVVLLPVA